MDHPHLARRTLLTSVAGAGASGHARLAQFGSLPGLPSLPAA